MERGNLRELVEQLLALAAGADGMEAPPQLPARADAAALRALGRRLRDELLAAGHLLRVEAEGAVGLAGPLFLVRGSTRLLDLALLAGPTPPGRRGAVPEAPEPAPLPEPGARAGGPPPLRPEALPEAAPPDRPPAPPAPGGPAPPATADVGSPAAPGPEPPVHGEGLELGAVDRILAAMDQAQNLRLGEPEGDEREAILAGVLALLGRFLPDLGLAILLEGPGRDRPEAGIFHRRAEGPEPFWLARRPEGAAIWIPSPAELPEALRDRLLATAGAAEPPGFAGAAAVSLREPAWGDSGTGRRPEVGLLVAASRREVPRGDLLALARRLAGFVTRRWRRTWDLNQRIHTDSLTGVRNRAFFDAQFALELERARRSRSPLTLVLADLDHFKRVNDRHGHPVGDRVLAMVAQALQDELRRVDHVCRIGGEEFALILPDTSHRQAREAVARVMRRLDAVGLSLPGRDRPLQVTLSCGVATFPEAGGDSYDLFRKADAMLYRSKRMGRHRCHFWNRHGEPTMLLPDGEA